MSGIVWQSAEAFIARQTIAIAREFKCSRPRPRNRVMGFKDEPRKRREQNNTVAVSSKT